MSNSIDYPHYFVVEDDVLIKYEGYENEVIVPEGIVAIENKAFWYNKTITKVSLPSTVKVIGSYAFCGCKALVEVEMPDGVVHIGKMAFNGCEKLEVINIPDTVEEIGAQAFGNCKSLPSINLPPVKKIPECALAGCESLNVVEVPDGAETIGEAAFYGCKEVETVVIPKSVEKIEPSAFEDCDGVEEIHYLGNEDEFNKIDKQDGWNNTVNGANIEYADTKKKPEPQKAAPAPTPAPAKKPLPYTSTAKNNPDGVKIGDKVVISDDGQRYSSYVSWFDDNAPELKSRFTSKSLMNGEYTVLAMGAHSDTNTDTIVCAIESAADKSVYLLGATGLKKATAPAKTPSFTSNSTNNPNGVAIGDTVVVSDSGQRYPNYSGWFDDNAPELKSRFSTSELPGGEYKILTMGYHSAGNDTICCAIEKAGGKVYLVGARGLKKASAATASSSANPLGIKVGDVVEVSDAGKQYSSYTAWLETNAPHLKSKFVNNKKVDTSAAYKVVAMANHSAGNSTMLAAIEAGSSVFILGVLGLKKSTRSVTTESYTLPTDLKAGDTVIVTDDMQRYTTYTSWFDTYAPEYRSSYAYNDDTIPAGTFTLVKIAPHTSDKSVFVCCLKHSNGKYYLIQKKGVAKAPTSPSVVSNSTNNPNGVKVGDTVIVSDSGKRYSSYSSWFTTNAPHLASRFAKDKPLPSGTFTILTMAYHSTGSTTICCAIENNADKSVHLIGAAGLKKSVASSYSSPSYTSNSTNNPNGVAVGDTVVISNSGQRYPSYSSWFDDNAPHLKSRFAKDRELVSGNYTILTMAMHSKGSTTLCCAIESVNTKDVYLIGATGVKKASTSSYTSSSVVSNSTNNPNGVKVGDTVIVSDSGKRYSSYSSWFTTNAPHLASRFAKDKPLPSGTFTILTMAYHSTGSTTICCAIENNADKSVHLIGAAGLKKSVASSYSSPSYTSNSTNNPNGVAVGDTVVISNSGQRYPSYSSWFTTNAPHLASRFAKDTELVSGNYTVLAMGMHSSGSTTLCCAIESVSTKAVYLIGATGVKKAYGSYGATSSFGGSSIGNLSNNPNGIRIGDTVSIVNSGKQYTTYSSWFDKNAPHLKSSFAYSVSINTYARYEVVAAAPHSAGSDTIVCAVKSKADGRVYLIGALGIKRA